MSWNYRVIKQEDGDESHYGIHEVYYNDDGSLFCYTDNCSDVFWQEGESGSDTTKTGPGGVRVISREQFRSGKFSQQITDGTARVDGYTDDVVSSPEGDHGRAGSAG